MEEVLLGGSYIGVECTNSTGYISLKQCTISSTFTGYGTTGAEISQSTGVISLTSTDLTNCNANGLYFTTTVSPTQYYWGHIGSVPANSTKYLYPGPSTVVSNIPFYFTVYQKCILRGLDVFCSVNPGVGGTSTFTLIKNDIDTPLQVIVSGNGTNVNTGNLTKSLTVNPGDRLSMRLDNVNANLLSDISVITCVY